MSLPKMRIDWARVTSEQKLIYAGLCEKLLSRITVPDAVHCKHIDCTQEHHRADLEIFSDKIISALNDASSCLLKRTCKKIYAPVPGWNDYVKETYEKARESFLLWLSNGKPRSGPIFEIMRVSRANFKYSLRYCKNIENKARADSLAKKFLSKDPIVFWKAIKRINNSNSTLSNTVNGSTGEAYIAAMWKHIIVEY